MIAFQSQLREMAAKDSAASGAKECKTKPNPLLVSSAFSQTPLSLPFSSPQVPCLVSAMPRNIIHQLQDSIVSAVDRWLNFVKLLAFQNPLLKNALSASSGFQSLSHEVVACRTVSARLSNHRFAAVLPGDSMAGIVVANGIMNFLNIYNTLLVVRLVLTWFPNTPTAIVSPLSTICDPYLNIFRGIIPPLGGTLDLSPILAFLALNAFTSTAAALPAELPGAGQPLVPPQNKWVRRLRAMTSAGAGHQ